MSLSGILENGNWKLLAQNFIRKMRNWNSYQKWLKYRKMEFFFGNIPGCQSLCFQFLAVLDMIHYSVYVERLEPYGNWKVIRNV